MQHDVAPARNRPGPDTRFSGQKKASFDTVKAGPGYGTGSFSPIGVGQQLCKAVAASPAPASESFPHFFAGRSAMVRPHPTKKPIRALFPTTEIAGRT